MATKRADTQLPAIVGIGASAGGIEAMKRFLSAAPADSGLGFVLVMHLQPHHKSHLCEVLRQATGLTVTEIVDGQRVAADTLHVIPPNATLTISGGVLHLRPLENQRRVGGIDSFFRALAEDEGDRAVCAVLSGAGSDGAVGLRAIKEHGGLALAARVESDGEFHLAQLSAHDSMPRAAAATGLADYIVSIEEMPGLAIEYARHLQDLAAPGRAGQLRARIEAVLPDICDCILRRTGHDLRQYKPATLLRRIQRRLQALRIADPADYVALLSESPVEVDALHKDILIGVTSFFRDPDAFAVLERNVIPRLLDRAEAHGGTVRVWVPGCGTGEEAYSLAMLLDEAMSHRRGRLDVQVFGTDVDGEAIRRARQGKYSPAVADQIGADRRQRYLHEENGGYRVERAIRDMCLFSEHDLTRHPPFSRIDLISCRNLLIYLDADLQGRVVPIFHYALRSGGYLFLGSSESLGQHPDLFDSIDKKHRIFQRRDTAQRRTPEFPLSGSIYRVPHMTTPPSRDEGARERLTRKAERLVLEQFGPAYVLVDANYDAVYFAPGIGRYLEPATGTPRSNVLDMARSGLRGALRRALRKAAQGEGDGGAVEDGADLTGPGGPRRVDIVVRPVQERRDEDQLLLVVFREPDAGASAPVSQAAAPPGHETATSELERELVDTKSDLQATIEELEASNEELQSANEELLSMNEELQSSNEELESSKEELQSVNEEMETVNDELRGKVEELNRANADLRNLIESTRIVTVFLDREKRIKWFTPDARGLFNLIASDVGRPFTDISGRLEEPPGRELDEVLENEELIERPVRRADGAAYYVMRLLPYRTDNGAVDGLVLTLVDITKLREATADLESVLDLVPVGIAMTRHDDAARIRINRYGRELLGLRSQDIERRDLEALFGTGDASGPAAALSLYEAARTGVAIAEREVDLHTADSAVTRTVLVSAVPLGEAGMPGRGAIMAFVDVSELKTAQRRTELLLRALRHRVRNMLANIRAVANETLSNSETLSDFEERFEGRLDALALIENILSRTGAGSVDLEELASALLQTGADARSVTLEGPQVTLDPKAAQMIALVLNELRTNAVKHGALVVGEGRIVVRWGVMTDNNGRPILRLRWQETGVEATADPASGFGRELIEQGVPHELGGRGSWGIVDGLLTCLVDLPLEPHVLQIGTEMAQDTNGDGAERGLNDGTHGCGDDASGPSPGDLGRR